MATDKTRRDGARRGTRPHPCARRGTTAGRTARACARPWPLLAGRWTACRALDCMLGSSTPECQPRAMAFAAPEALDTVDDAHTVSATTLCPRPNRTASIWRFGRPRPGVGVLWTGMTAGGTYVDATTQHAAPRTKDASPRGRVHVYYTGGGRRSSERGGECGRSVVLQFWVENKRAQMRCRARRPTYSTAVQTPLNCLLAPKLGVRRGLGVAPPDF